MFWSQIWEADLCESFFDLGVDLMFKRLGGHFEGVFDCKSGRASVGDDHHTVDAEKRASSVRFIIGAILNGLEGASAKECSGDADRILFELFFHPFGHGLGGGFATFKNDVAGEAVAEADVELGLEKVVAFNITTEGEGGVALFD